METCRNYVALHDKIKNIKIITMTVNRNGKMISFPLPTVQTECEGFMWFFMKLTEEQIRDLEIYPSANVSFSESKVLAYVSVTGKVERCDDRSKMEELWKPNLEEILKVNLSSKELVLINRATAFRKD